MSNRPAHEAAQLLRGLKDRFERSQEEREPEGRVTSVVGLPDDTASATDTLSATDREPTIMEWNVDSWSMSQWGDA